VWQQGVVGVGGSFYMGREVPDFLDLGDEAWGVRSGLQSLHAGRR
jgi:hypothetical protein